MERASESHSRASQVDPQLVITALRLPPLRGRQFFVAQAERAICGADESMTTRDRPAASGSRRGEVPFAMIIPLISHEPLETFKAVVYFRLQALHVASQLPADAHICVEVSPRFR